MLKKMEVHWDRYNKAAREENKFRWAKVLAQLIVDTQRFESAAYSMIASSEAGRRSPRRSRGPTPELASPPRKKRKPMEAADLEKVDIVFVPREDPPPPPPPPPQENETTTPKWVAPVVVFGLLIALAWVIKPDSTYERERLR